MTETDFGKNGGWGWTVQNDEPILAGLMSMYGKSVWRYIYMMTKDANVTDDLTQDVFMKVYERLGTFQNQASVKTWIFAIAKNRCKDYFKSSLFKRVILFRDIDTLDPRNVEDEVIRFIQGREVLSALFRTKPLYREIVLLRINEELSFREIAQILGISEGNSKVRYQRAIKQVQRLLREEGSSDEA